MKTADAKHYDAFLEWINIFKRAKSVAIRGKHYGDYVREVLKYFHMEPNAEIFR
jgi:hypothetical protein